MRVPPEELSHILALWREGKNRRQISALTGRNISTIGFLILREDRREEAMLQAAEERGESVPNWLDERCVCQGPIGP